MDDDFWRLYRDAMFNDKTFARGESEVDEILERVAGETVPAGMKILDLACGPGRHSLPLALAGHEVTAIDASAYLLDWARERARAADASIDFEQADMREFVKAQAFDLVVCMWSSFGYFEDPAEDIEVLANVHASLASGGSFLLDTMCKEWLTRHIEPVHLRELDDDTLLIERPLIEDDMTRVSNQWILIRGDRADTREWSHNLYSGAELRDRLYSVGFDEVTLYGSLAGDDFDLDAERLVIVARKN